MSFEQIFNQKSEIKEQAHARVNIIGEHTDYTGGFVMPTLLKFKTSVEIFFTLMIVDWRVLIDPDDSKNPQWKKNIVQKWTESCIELDEKLLPKVKQAKIP